MVKYQRRKSKQWSFIVPFGPNSITNLNQTIDDHRVEYITYSKNKKHILGYVRTKKYSYPETFSKVIGLSNAIINVCPPSIGRDVLLKIQMNKQVWEAGVITAQKKIRSDIERLKFLIHEGKRLPQLRMKICSTYAVLIQEYIDFVKASVVIKGRTRHTTVPKITKTMFGNTQMTEVIPGGSSQETKTACATTKARLPLPSTPSNPKFVTTSSKEKPPDEDSDEDSDDDDVDWDEVDKHSDVLLDNIRKGYYAREEAYQPTEYEKEKIIPYLNPCALPAADSEMYESWIQTCISA